MSTKNQTFLISALLLSCSLPVSAGADQAMRSWVVERCAAYRGGYCRIPFAVALASAKDLTSMAIGVQLRGYLVREPDGYALYADRDTAQRGWRTDAILIQPSTQQEIAKSLALRDQSLVVVKGRILLVASDHDEYWIQLAVETPVTVAAVVGDRLKK